MVISKSMLHHSCNAISFLYINWRPTYHAVEEVLRAGGFFYITVNFATRSSDSWVYRGGHDFVYILDGLERPFWPPMSNSSSQSRHSRLQNAIKINCWRCLCPLITYTIPRFLFVHLATCMSLHISNLSSHGTHVPGHNALLGISCSSTGSAEEGRLLVGGRYE